MKKRKRPKNCKATEIRNKTGAATDHGKTIARKVRSWQIPGYNNPKRERQNKIPSMLMKK